MRGSTMDGAVIFDMDGVLVMSLPAHWVAWRATAAAHGVDLTHEMFLRCNGLTNPDICALLWGPRATPEFVTRVAEAKNRAFQDAIGTDVPLAPAPRTEWWPESSEAKPRGRWTWRRPREQAAKAGGSGP